jgi:hypothetical protein
VTVVTQVNGGDAAEGQRWIDATVASIRFEPAS